MRKLAQITAQLVDEGKINLDAEVQTYVRYFPKKQGQPLVGSMLYCLP